MATTNFLEWDPPLTNAELDVTYAADSMRLNGAAASAILPSPITNKVLHQASIFPAAFCQMLVAKGYSTSDADQNALATVLANVKTSADFPAAIVTVTYGTTITFDAATSYEFFLQLTGDVASSSFTHTAPGQELLVIIQQDATGNRAFPWPVSGIIGAGPICSIANSYSIQTFVVLPSGTLAAITRMQWLSSTGVVGLPDTLVVSQSTSGTVASGYREVTEKVDASGGVVTRTFYAASPILAGYKININKTDSSQNAVLATASSGQFINGSFANFPISVQFNSLTFQCDGSGWILI